MINFASRPGHLETIPEDQENSSRDILDNDAEKEELQDEMSYGPDGAR